MISPFLIKLKDSKYIFLNDEQVELYEDFPFYGDTQLLDISDNNRKFVQEFNMSMISHIFIKYSELSNLKKNMCQLLSQGSSSILKILIDLDNEFSYQHLLKDLLTLRKELINFRGIGYGLILFYIRIKKQEFNQEQLQHLHNNNISVINYNYDYNIIPSIDVSNWIICTQSKTISEIVNQFPNSPFIFDLSKMLLSNQIEDIIKILNLIKKFTKKRMVRLFPMSVNRLFLHHNLDTYCNCASGHNICHFSNSNILYSCPSYQKIDSAKANCSNCELQNLCGSCTIGISEKGTCSIKRLFSEYYSDILKHSIEI